MDEKKEVATTDESHRDAPNDTDTPQPGKAYKKPTIRRHGNLRLMTQLE